MTPERAIETSGLTPPKKVRKNCGCTVWMDFDMVKDLDLIAAYEHMERGPIIRLILVEKVRCYKRNPAYKRFLVDLKRTQEAPKKGKEDL